VKAVAIQFSPMTKWPTPNHQPSAAPRRNPRRLTSWRISNASPIRLSGHQPIGAKPSADNRPAMKAVSEGTARAIQTER
jgi:hypothetical protein